MLSKFCMQLLVGVSVICSSVYSAARVHSGVAGGRVHAENRLHTAEHLHGSHAVAGSAYYSAARVHHGVAGGRVHVENRLHEDRLHQGNYNVNTSIGRNAHAAPSMAYGRTLDALDDYDMGGNSYVEVGQGAFFGAAAARGAGGGSSSSFRREEYEVKGSRNWGQQRTH